MPGPRGDSPIASVKVCYDLARSQEETTAGHQCLAARVIGRDGHDCGLHSLHKCGKIFFGTDDGGGGGEEQNQRKGDKTGELSTIHVANTRAKTKTLGRRRGSRAGDLVSLKKRVGSSEPTSGPDILDQIAAIRVGFYRVLKKEGHPERQPCRATLVN